MASMQNKVVHSSNKRYEFPRHLQKISKPPVNFPLARCCLKVLARIALSNMTKHTEYESHDYRN